MEFSNKKEQISNQNPTTFKAFRAETTRFRTYKNLHWYL
jgi:hypothetical protein